MALVPAKSLLPAMVLWLGCVLLTVLPVSAQAGAGSTPDRPDLLSWAAGAFAVRLEEPATNATIRNAIDGSPRTLGIGIPRREPLPHRFVVELPALTIFEAFAVPVINEFGPARGRHVRTVVIEGSSEGPEGGFSPLATLLVEMDRNAQQDFPVPAPRAVRWLRIEFADRLLPPPADFDEAVFSELIGYGVQEPIEVPDDRYTGRWRLRRTGINDVPGVNVIELVQRGTSIQGCEIRGGQHGVITGAIVDGLAHLTVESVGAPAPVPVIATVTEEGDLVGARFVSGYSDFWASADPDATVECAEVAAAEDPMAAALVAGDAAIVHGINFDVDSDVLRSDAIPALERVLSALETAGTLSVTIEGHTDSDGSEEYNLDLSARRAAAVVRWLIERGVQAGRLEPAGIGEARPIADNESSAGRALNRRVEIHPR